ncbi:unnamed protein product [Bemisia tabaci]|uniref:Histone deacetylase complex subunit SAP130 C-terminal domain-containing protein n=1 Tax=Bemisia tabaci TaxID=7038 RepID=A0A9P0F8V1_BEMTA|nr:unnamed protein product [Bemisia tabaci]
MGDSDKDREKATLLDASQAASAVTVIKPDSLKQTPSIVVSALRNVPPPPTRLLNAPLQAVQSLSQSTAVGHPNIPKQVVAVNRQSLGETIAVANRLNTNATTYHIPRGPAAVASISVPRATIATPINIRNSVAGLQTIPVTSISNTSNFVSGIGVLNRGNGSWIVTTASTVPTKPSPATLTSFVPSRPPTLSGTAVSHSSPNFITTRLSAPPNSREPGMRPVLFHASQRPPQLNESKSYLAKSGVGMVPMRTSLGAGQTLVYTGPGGQNSVVTQPPSTVPRLAPSIVSLPVLAPVLKNASHQNTGPKVITQPAHGLTMQIASVSVAQQPNLSISKPVGFPISSNVSITQSAPSQLGPSVLASRVLPTSNVPPASTISLPPGLNVSKEVIPIQSSGSQPLFIQTPHKPAPSPSIPSSSGPGPYFSQETTSGFPVVSRSFPPITTVSGTPPSTQPVPTLRPIQHDNIPSNVSLGQSSVPPVRTLNVGMVVESSRVITQPYITPESSSCYNPPLGNVSQSTTQADGQPSQIVKQNASPRPSILRKRETDGSPLKAQKNLTPILASFGVTTPAQNRDSRDNRDLTSPPPSPKRPDSGGQSSGGSTTISATSSPVLGGTDSPPIKTEPVAPPIEEDRPVEMSPRKKPRKQLLTSNDTLDSKFSEEEMEFISEDKIKKEVKEESNEDGKSCQVKRPNISLLSSYRHAWKSRYHHFLRYSDVKPRDDRRPTVNDIASHKHVMQKVNGWKIHHLSSQMEDVSDLETEVLDKLSDLLQALEKKSDQDTEKEFNHVCELIKGNIQRSKVIKDQMEEAKSQVMKIFDHKDYVKDIISRCASKRAIKKREKY